MASKGRPFKKGYDPNRNTEQTFRKGDGKKRKPFVAGEDERRISAERLDEVRPFKEGHTLASHIDSPKVSPAARADLIPAEFQVDISPHQTAVELLPMLTDAIDVGMRMMSLIESSEHVGNAIEIGLYGALVNKCVKTRAAIEGGGVQPAPFGELCPETVEKTKEEYAFVLRAQLSKLNHGFMWFAKKGHDGMFDKHGKLRLRAGKAMRTLISTARATIELRAQLDAWEAGRDRGRSVVEGAIREVLSGS